MIVDHFLERADWIGRVDTSVLLIVEVELFVDDDSVLLDIG